MNIVRSLITIMIVIISTVGCSTVRDYVSIATDKGVSKEYLAVLDQWTRSRTVHSEFETKATISATLKTKAFQKAYLAEYERFYKIPESDRSMREKLQGEMDADITDFFFYAYTPNKDHNDFEKGNSIWKVFLLDESGRRTDPVEIRRIEPVTPVMENFYPYLNLYYGHSYSIKFPALKRAPEDKAKPLQMIVTGVDGEVRLIWP